MPRWSVPLMWSQQDAYVIGGGDSLRGFEWGLLRGKNTIGCNSSFALGSQVCKVCLFGDENWWFHVGSQGTGEKGPGEHGLPGYGGLAVGCPPRDLRHTGRPATPWLLTLERSDRVGLSTDPRTLAWNGNTGAMAINLALLMGARRVFLLGFDMKAPQGRMNYHDIRFEPGNPQCLTLFAPMFHYIARDLKGTEEDRANNQARTAPKFEGSEVWNVTNDSNLNAFPKVGVLEHFKGGLK